MPSAEQLTPEKRFMGLFISRSGAGKTCAEDTWISPEAKKAGKKIRVFDFDNRIRGILGCPWIDRSIIDYTYYPPKVQITDKLALHALNEDLATLTRQADNYETVILDSLTSSTFALLCDAVAITHQTKSASGAGGKGKYLGTMAMPGPE